MKRNIIRYYSLPNYLIDTTKIKINLEQVWKQKLYCMDKYIQVVNYM